MDYYKVQYHVREFSKLIVESYKEGDITGKEANKRLQDLEELAYETFPYLEPDGDVTYSVAVAADEIKITY